MPAGLSFMFGVLGLFGLEVAEPLPETVPLPVFLPLALWCGRYSFWAGESDDSLGESGDSLGESGDAGSDSRGFPHPLGISGWISRNRTRIRISNEPGE